MCGMCCELKYFNWKYMYCFLSWPIFQASKLKYRSLLMSIALMALIEFNKFSNISIFDLCERYDLVYVVKIKIYRTGKWINRIIWNRTTYANGIHVNKVKLYTFYRLIFTRFCTSAVQCESSTRNAYERFFPPFRNCLHFYIIILFCSSFFCGACFC